MIADKEVPLGSIEAVEPMGSAEIRDAEGEICTDAEQSLDRSQFAGNARLSRNSNFERRKGFCR